jgi:hypothetical protein
MERTCNAETTFEQNERRWLQCDAKMKSLEGGMEETLFSSL